MLGVCSGNPNSDTDLQRCRGRIYKRGAVLLPDSHDSASSTSTTITKLAAAAADEQWQP